MEISFSAKDFLQIIHVVDMDGAFIGPDHVQKGNVLHPVYTDEYIETSDVKGIIERNEQKAENLKRLIGVKRFIVISVWRLLFFFESRTRAS